ncbi:alpha/beta hydrolase family protein [Microbulbifer pacificus]|uniref:alpha/beta hydrolase family protein n=1 Tax=Microbulbifer pacificus TaxID=407164 RepID=UPI000CF50196|nr:S9 family peptidase [Microbulbifer pacificus]
MNLRFWGAFCCAAGLMFSASLYAAESDIFSDLPLVSNVSISPDGEQLLSVVNSGGKTLVATAPFGSKKINYIVGLEEGKYRIESVDWLNNERVLVTVTQPERVDVYGHKTRVRLTSLYSVSIDGKSTIELNKRDLARDGLDLLRLNPSVLTILPNDEDHILVELADPRDDYYSSVFKVNVNTGKYTKYLQNDLQITNWGIDRTGQVRFALGADTKRESTVRHVYFRESNSESWKKVASFDVYKEASFYPFLYEAETHSLLVESNRQLGKDAIWRYDLKKGGFTDLVGEAPDNLDIQGPIFWRTQGRQEFIGFSYVDNFVEHKYLNLERANISQQLMLLFQKKGLKSHVVAQDESGNRMVVYAVSDNSPGKYYLFDRKAKSLSFWFSQYPKLEAKKLAKVEPFSFEASDGMKLNGYLTRPEGISDAPLVVFPHGGPHARDTQYFDPWVQMFANSGYAVLQVNFRGSSGFGDEYLAAGYKQWGKAMQQDVIDAVNWVEQNKLADTKRSCIVGGSYGGYVALTAGFKTPDKFDCVVSLAGVSDIPTMMSFDSVRGYNRYFKQQLADIHSSEDMKDVEENSPLNFANRFSSPVLLIHGLFDTRVDVGQSKMMARALEREHKKVELFILENGTHHFNESGNRKVAMGEVLSFLDDNLK